nr:hypothetical protein [Tanacetum cinerariifolium]
QRVIERRLRRESMVSENQFNFMPGRSTTEEILKSHKDMYDGAKTRVRSSMRNTEFFPVEVDLHKGSSISPYLFALILDELSQGIQGNIPWSMVFADDVMVAIRPAMLYGSECWPITKAQANRVEEAKLRMLRWTCGKTMLDMIPNEVVRAELEVESIIHKMREGRLRWFGHVRRRPQTAPVRRVEALFFDGLRRRGRQKLRWEDRLK